MNKTLSKYQAWVGKNADSGIDVVEINTDTGTVATTTHDECFLRCIIVVKFIGRAVM